MVDTTEENVMPPVADDRLYLVAAAGLEPFRAVFDALSQVNVYCINPEEMRRPQKPEDGDLLRRDGSNVASVLERLRREQPAAKSRIEGYLGQIVAGVTSVDRRGLGAWELWNSDSRSPEIPRRGRFRPVRCPTDHDDHRSRKALRESLFTAGELIRVDQLEPEPNSAQQLELFR